jgi:hypothetical protein
MTNYLVAQVFITVVVVLALFGVLNGIGHRSSAQRALIVNARVIAGWPIPQEVTP